jgi:hypothetical protein
MQVTEHVHALKVPFPGTTRFVYAYLIYAAQVAMVDSGIAPAKEMVFDYLRKTGHDPKEIRWLLQTHSHGDHIGLSAAIRKISGCQVVAHGGEKDWIEDIDKQYRERPTPTFRTFVHESAKVDRVVKDGDTLGLGGGENLRVIHTPGHSPADFFRLPSGRGPFFRGRHSGSRGPADLFRCFCNPPVHTEIEGRPGIESPFLLLARSHPGGESLSGDGPGFGLHAEGS